MFSFKKYLVSYYDILEDRVPAGLVAEYESLLENCSKCFQQFSELRSGLCADSDSELDNVSMVEGLKLCDYLETFKRKLHIIENPLLRCAIHCPALLHPPAFHTNTCPSLCSCPGTCWPTKETSGSSASRAVDSETRV